jgi:uroporphyrinogen-III synthase
VTRPREESAELCRLLEALGARVLAVPAIRCVPAGVEALRAAASRRGEYTHIVFTSPRAVESMARLSRSLGIPCSDWGAVRTGTVRIATVQVAAVQVAAVGPRTAERARAEGWEASVVGREGALALARRLVESGEVGPRALVLFPRGAKASPEALEILATAGARIEAPTVYDTVLEDAASAGAALEEALGSPPPDAVLFASPSALEGFLESTGDAGRTFLSSPQTKIASIGPTTSEALRRHGLRVAAEADPPGVRGLVEAALRALGPR